MQILPGSPVAAVAAGIKEITANFGLDPELPFVANVDDLLIEEEALNNPGVGQGRSERPACWA
jgi:hypothetical protein